jgi:hypothetical protein
VTLSLALRHPRFGPLPLPLLALLYVCRQTMSKIPAGRGWTFATKLVLAARLLEWIAPIVKKAGKTLWVVVDGGYVKAPFFAAGLARRGDGRGAAAQRRGLARPAAEAAAGSAAWSPVHPAPQPPAGNRPVAFSWFRQPRARCLRLFWHCACRAASRAACTAGSKSAIRMPMIVMTTNSSTNVSAGRCLAALM